MVESGCMRDGAVNVGRICILLARRRSQLGVRPGSDPGDLTRAAIASPVRTINDVRDLASKSASHV